jgi:hypothetical protein
LYFDAVPLTLAFNIIQSNQQLLSINGKLDAIPVAVETVVAHSFGSVANYGIAERKESLELVLQRKPRIVNYH